MIVGTHSGVGKSLFATGLAVALRKRGLSVSACVTGRAVHQGLILSRITRRYARTLDRRLLTPGQILNSMYQAGLGADLILIDGHGGLYDGVACGDARGSDSEIAVITKTPSVLVANIESFSNSAAALIKGYSLLLGDVGVRAVVANKIISPLGADPFSPNPEVVQLNDCMQAYRLAPIVGGVTNATFPTPLPGSGFSQDENLTSLAMQFFLDVGSLISNHVDLDKLIEIAGTAQEIELPEETDSPKNRRCRIAVSDDSCFNVTFQDNLDLLRFYGAELVTFSPLADMELPARINGVYLTGAYLRSCAEELVQNEAMRTALMRFAGAGGMIFSEGAGTAYLSRSFQIDRSSEPLEGVNLLPLDVGLMSQQPTRIEAELITNSFLGEVGTRIQGVSLGDFVPRGVDFDTARTLQHLIQVSVDGTVATQEGYAINSNSFSTFHFLHLGSNPQVAKAIVETAASVSIDNSHTLE